MYVTSDEDARVFRRIPAPTAAQLERVLQRISQRIGRYLERKGLLVRDVERSDLQLDAVSDDGACMDSLRGHSITYRMAIDVCPKHEKAPAFDAIEILRDPSHSHAITCAEVRAIGKQLGLEKIAVNEYVTRFPLEAVLKTSFPEQGMLDRLRRLFRMDAERGGDAFGLGTQIENDELIVAYPMSMVVWKKNHRRCHTEAQRAQR